MKHLESISVILEYFNILPSASPLFSSLPRTFVYQCTSGVHVDRWQTYTRSGQLMHRDDSVDADIREKCPSFVR